ncbi:Fc.00g021340.m01.CDS01 [Cosmosporella sp. VM-42]
MPPKKRAAVASVGATEEPLPKRRSLWHAPKTEGKYQDSSEEPEGKPKSASKRRSTRKKIKKEDTEENGNGSRASSEDLDVDSIPTTNPDAPRHDGEWYWLMKAEPETRLENGIDVRFSIDDLRQKEKPEGWDGIRNYAARNHMRNMNAGDKAFFYHSNCKVPGIVGIMEIVKEYSEDKSALVPGTPYYDPKSTKEKPKWDLVHVEFRKKFAVQIGLQELKELGKPGGPLETMQMLKQSRLSVSRVSAEEWEALCEIADQKAKEAGLEHE